MIQEGPLVLLLRLYESDTGGSFAAADHAFGMIQ
jgi:hypothetical protein